jgi:hypothetical protein
MARSIEQELAVLRAFEAFEPVVAWCDRCTPEERHRVGYLALALLRSEAATGYLLETVATAGRGDAVAAARALATFKDDPAITERLRVAIAGATDATVHRELAGLLDD